MAKNIDFMGAVFPDVPSVKLPQQGGGLVAFDDTTDATATADKILQGYTAYANGQKLTGTASGGITPSGTYSITSNGIYDIVSFASVDVNVSGGGGGDHDAEDGLITRAVSEYSNSRVTTIGEYAFYKCTSLTTVSFPNVTSIGSNAFNSCAKLTTVSFPNVTSIFGSAFYNCAKLTTVSFPNVTSIPGNAFRSCTSLTTASFPKATSIFGYAFAGCTRLESFYILASSAAKLIDTNAFSSTPMSLSSYLGHFGSIYVPASLVDSYKSAKNWSSYSARITAYTE